MALKRVLLTGGSGFIGRNILESTLKDRYEWISPLQRELDLGDTGQVDEFFRKQKIDFIVHAAVKPGHRNSADRAGVYYANMRMFLNLARHSQDVERMLFFGSGAAYDMAHYQPRMPEEFFGVHLPADEYGLAKHTCARLIESSRNIVELRLFGVFGKHEDYAIRFISNLMCKCIFGLPLTMKQDRRFDYLYAPDLMPVLDHFLRNAAGQRAYNVTPNQSVSLLDLAGQILRLSGKDLEIRVASPGLGVEYSGDNTRLKAEFPGFSPRPLEQSLPELYEWYRAQAGSIRREALLQDK